MKSIVPIILNQLTGVALGFVYWKLINKFVPPAINGPFGSFFVTLSTLALLVTHSGLVNHATRYWQRESHEPGTYVRFLLSASCWQLRFLAPLLLAICVALSLARRELFWVAVFPLLLFSNFALALNSIAIGVLNAEHSAWKFFLLSSVGTAARTFLTIGMALALGMTVWTLSVGYTFHALLIGLCLSLLFAWAVKAPPATPERRRVWLQELRDYGRPFVLLGAGAWCLQNADRWVVGGFFDDRAGLFVFAVGLGAVIPTMLVAALMQMYFPGIFRKADEAKSSEQWRAIARQCDQITLLFLALSVVGLFVLKAIIPFLVGPLISERYVPSIDMLIPAGFAVVSSQINQFHYLLLQGQHNSAAMVRVMSVVAGVKTAGSLVAAAISWSALMNWMIFSVILAGLIGRFMIRRIALAEPMIKPAPN